MRERGWQAEVVIEEWEALDFAALRSADLVGISTITSTAPRAYAIAGPRGWENTGFLGTMRPMKIMNRTFRIRSRIALCLLAPSFWAAAAIPHNVRDYLTLLPDAYLGFEDVKIPASERLAMIEIDDTANGWLRLAGRSQNAFEGWIDLALFSKGPAGPMIGVTVNRCGPLCEQQLFFLQYARGDWHDLTASVFQPLAADRVKELYRALFPGDEFADDPPVLYRLPRRGTGLLLVTQEAIAGREAVLARFRLVGGRFVVELPRG